MYPRASLKRSVPKNTMKRQTLFFKRIYSMKVSKALGIVTSNGFLDLIYEQLILQSREPLWIPSALVETSGFGPTIMCDTRSSSTSSLKMLTRKRKCLP